jgi:hypothetical protein
MLNIRMKRYAFCKQMIETKGGWLLQPWMNAGAKIYDTIEQVPDDCILISIHHPPWRSPYKEWIDKGRNHIEIDYGYWGINNPRRNTRRVTYNGSHNLKQRKIPYSRIETLNPPIESWKEKRGNYLLLIEPQPDTLKERTGINFGDWRNHLLENLKHHWDGPIKWRRKAGGKNAGRWPTFLSDLSECHAVVGERTMACVEAVILGYPAYTTDISMVSLLMGNDFSLIKNPIFPDRTEWLEHVAWSQFTPEEFLQGTKVVQLVELYQM